ncbi:MAG: hypothetical protein ACJ0Q6_05375 [Candidatus Azotimanducaceae bacterium]|uniref:Uncharacterized protein n=1 Tax=OM182 bacterium TaxID=2510334 RepID=A0A520RZW4_9GAMM|nr:hypothetical protein [Gammaproteobacteria bacterium]RZO75763.1 MAG: hypothetical protein EVA68_06100 [OM182 bacterium]
MTINLKNLELAAKAAIQTWAMREEEISEQTRTIARITETFLQSWLGYWMLARSNPRSLRAPLAEYLNDKVRPVLIDSVTSDLPSQIPILANMLHEAGATRGIQTSLVSKFAFCLRPEMIVPYDQHAKRALKIAYETQITDHDYETYYGLFSRLKDSVSEELDASGIPKRLEEYWAPKMSKKLFHARTADKFLMLLGGFSADTMQRDLKKFFQ